MTLISKIISYRKNHTLSETGEKFGITGERVRQILYTKYQKRCRVHNRLYYNKCSYCLNRAYKTWMEKLDYRMLMVEVDKEAKNRKRDWLSVQRKMYLVRRLHDKHEKSLIEISNLLGRNYSTITNLYDKSNTK